MKEELLNEEKYQSNKKKISTIALLILIIGLLLGGILISLGVIKSNEINSKYSEPYKDNLMKQLKIEEKNLHGEKEKLEEKIKPAEDEIKKLSRVKFEGFDDEYYKRQDRIEELSKSISADKKQLSIINEVLENGEFACHFEAKNNKLTSKYCDMVTNLVKSSNDFNKSFDLSDSYVYYGLGGFVIFSSLMISAAVYSITKRREIMAFSAQQMMPLAQEGLEKMAPSVGKAGAEMIEEIAPTYKKVAKDVAPIYGDIAKEITKGVKKGLEGNKKVKKTVSKKKTNSNKKSTPRRKTNNNKKTVSKKKTNSKKITQKKKTVNK